MNFLKKLFDKDPFFINKKEFFFNDKILTLTKYHYKKSTIYKLLIDKFDFNFKAQNNLNNFPYLPITLFKELDLISVPKNNIVKTLFSSGTSGSGRSKIFLDKTNSLNQIKALKSIMTKFLGYERLPMLIIDRDPRSNTKDSFTAKSAAIFGFSIFGKEYTYLLDKNNNINYHLLNEFLKKFHKKKFFVFGFTSFIYENLIIKINSKKLKYKMNNALLLHGGGWKKMEEKKISNEIFKKKLLKKFKIRNVQNYYGLVEQTGSIFIECPNCNSFITSVYSDVLIRDNNFKVLKNGSKGLIQLFSLIPTSYPGHSIITEDIGAIINKKSNCKINAKHFVVYGRSKKSEIRGCSDV
jgi:hypothetical protein